MVKIILASHGPMAEAMITSSKMLYGENNQVVAICLYPEDDINEFASRLRNEIEGYEEVLLFVDIPGGTPSNQGMLLSKYPGLRVISGMNLMMFLEALIQCENTNVDDLKNIVLKSGKESIREMSIIDSQEDILDILLD